MLLMEETWGVKVYVDVVLGLQYGDEGKGKITHHLAKKEKYDYDQQCYH